MKFSNKEHTREQIQAIKNKYKRGTKIKLIKMYDLQAPSPETEGIVEFVDDIGQIHIKWNNGSSLALIENVDMFRVLEYANENTNNENEEDDYDSNY